MKFCEGRTHPYGEAMGLGDDAGLLGHLTQRGYLDAPMMARQKNERNIGSLDDVQRGQLR